MPDYAFFEFYVDPSKPHQARLNVRCRYGEGQIETKGGVGVWEEVSRPYLDPLTIWRGPKEAYKHKIPFLLDGWTSEKDVAPACEEINRMCGFTPQGIQRPPVLILDCYGTVPHDFTNNPSLRWVIAEAPEWGARDVTPDGRTLRVAGKLTFMLLNDDEASLRRDLAPKTGQPHMEAKRGQTFESIASHRLKHPHWGTRLANLNGRQNARETLHPGQTVFLPTKAEEHEWERSQRR